MMIMMIMMMAENCWTEGEDRGVDNSNTGPTANN